MLMTQDVNTVLADLPCSIAAYTIANADMSYTVVLNSSLNYERQLQLTTGDLIPIDMIFDINGDIFGSLE